MVQFYLTTSAFSGRSQPRNQKRCCTNEQYDCRYNEARFNELKGVGLIVRAKRKVRLEIKIKIKIKIKNKNKNKNKK